MTHRDRQPGLGLTLIGAIIAFVAALVAYLWQDSGVAGTAGAALALAGTVAVAAASAAALFVLMPHGSTSHSNG